MTCFWNAFNHVISSWDVYDKFCCKMFLCSMFPWASFCSEVPIIWKLIYLLLNSIKWNIWSLWPLLRSFQCQANEQVMKFYCQTNKSLHLKVWNLNMKNEAKVARFVLFEILNLDATWSKCLLQMTQNCFSYLNYSYQKERLLHNLDLFKAT